MLFLIVFFGFLTIFLLPLYRKQGKEGMPAKKWYVLPMVVTAVAGFVVALGAQIILKTVMIVLNMSGIVTDIIFAFIGAALVEELLKFGVGYAFIKKSKVTRKIDYIFILGACGLGFEIIESLLMSSGGLIAGIVRGALCLHVFFQLYMGAQLFEYKKAKEIGDKVKAKASLLKMWLIPFFLHGFNDIGSFFITRGVDVETSAIIDSTVLIAGAAIWAVTLVFYVIFFIRTYRITRRAAIDSREEEAKQITENE